MQNFGGKRRMAIITHCEADIRYQYFDKLQNFVLESHVQFLPTWNFLRMIKAAATTAPGMTTFQCCIASENQSLPLHLDHCEILNVLRNRIS